MHHLRLLTTLFALLSSLGFAADPCPRPAKRSTLTLQEAAQQDEMLALTLEKASKECQSGAPAACADARQRCSSQQTFVSERAPRRDVTAFLGDLQGGWLGERYEPSEDFSRGIVDRPVPCEADPASLLAAAQERKQSSQRRRRLVAEYERWFQWAEGVQARCFSALEDAQRSAAAAQERARQEAEEKTRAENERREKERQAQEAARRETERKRNEALEADRKRQAVVAAALAEKQRREKEEAARRAQEDQERRAKEEAERRAEAQRQAQEAEKERQEAARRAREEAERETRRKAEEAEEARVEAERQARRLAEDERQARERAEREAAEAREREEEKARRAAEYQAELEHRRTDAARRQEELRAAEEARRVQVDAEAKARADADAAHREETRRELERVKAEETARLEALRREASEEEAAEAKRRAELDAVRAARLAELAKAEEETKRRLAALEQELLTEDEKAKKRAELEAVALAQAEERRRAEAEEGIAAAGEVRDPRLRAKGYAYAGGAFRASSLSTAPTAGSLVGGALGIRHGFWFPPPEEGLSSGIEMLLAGHFLTELSAGTEQWLRAAPGLRLWVGRIGLGGLGEYQRVQTTAAASDALSVGPTFSYAFADSDQTRLIATARWLPRLDGTGDAFAAELEAAYAALVAGLDVGAARPTQGALAWYGSLWLGLRYRW